jgi:hypothetical protein
MLRSGESARTSTSSGATAILVTGTKSFSGS